MKKISIIILLFFCYQSIFGQSIISLDDKLALDRNSQDYPANLTYIKDTNHRLDSLAGIWKGFNGGRSYEIVFTKLEYVYFISPPDPGDFRIDRLIGRLLVKDSITNSVIYNTLNVGDNDASFDGYDLITPRVYSMSFSGPENGCYDYGDVNILLYLNDPARMTLSYHRGGDLIDPNTCPGGYANYRSVLPATLFLQKQ